MVISGSRFRAVRAAPVVHEIKEIFNKKGCFRLSGLP
jgi:hypothetical protein